MEKYRVFLDRRRLNDLFQKDQTPLWQQVELPIMIEGYQVGYRPQDLLCELENPTTLGPLESQELTELLQSSSRPWRLHKGGKPRRQGLGVQLTKFQERVGGRDIRSRGRVASLKGGSYHAEGRVVK